MLLPRRQRSAASGGGDALAHYLEVLCRCNMRSHGDLRETSSLLEGGASHSIVNSKRSNSDSDSDSDSTPWRQRRSVAVLAVSLLAAAVVGVAAVSSTGKVGLTSFWSQPEKPRFSGKVPDALVPAVLSDAGDTLSLYVYNEDYDKQPDSLGSYYKWSYNLEPGRDNHLDVSMEGR
jgi:hypothetical protein